MTKCRQSVLLVALLVLLQALGCTACDGGVIAGAVLGTAAACCLIGGIIAFILWKRNRTGKYAPTQKVQDDIEARVGHDNRAFHGDDLDPATRKKRDGGAGSEGYIECREYDSPHQKEGVSRNGAVSRKLIFSDGGHPSSLRYSSHGSSGSLNDTQGNDIIRVPLQSQDIVGLGFNIAGSLSDGIYVSQVDNRGPASESGKIHPGDRIQSLTISFKNMVYEDALTILSYASPYPVIVEIERSPQTLEDIDTPKDDTSLVLTHPLYRSQSDAELSKISNKQDPETMMYKIRRIRSEMKRDSSNRRGSHDDSESPEGTLRKWQGKQNIVVTDESRRDDSTLNVTDVNMDPDALLAQADLNRQNRDVLISKDGEVRYKKGIIVDSDQDVILKVDEPRKGVTIKDDTKVVVHTTDIERHLKRKSESDEEGPPPLPESPPPMKRSRDASQESLTDKQFVDYHKLPAVDKMDVLRVSYDGPASFDKEDVTMETRRADIEQDDREISVHTKAAAPGVVIGTGLASQGDDQEIRYDYKEVELAKGELEYEGPDRDSRELRDNREVYFPRVVKGKSRLDDLQHDYEGQEVTVTSQDVISGVDVGSGDPRVVSQRYETEGQSKLDELNRRYEMAMDEATGAVEHDGGTRYVSTGSRLVEDSPDVRRVEYELGRTDKLEELNANYETSDMTQEDIKIIREGDRDVRISGDTRYTTKSTTQRVIIDPDVGPGGETRTVEYELQGTEKLEELDANYETPAMAQEETIVTTVTRTDGQIRESRDRHVVLPGGMTRTTTTTVVEQDRSSVDDPNVVEYELRGTDKLEELNTNYETEEMAQDETIITSVTRHGKIDDRTSDVRDRDVIIAGGRTKTTTVVDRDSTDVRDRRRIVEYDLKGTEKLEELNTYYETPEMAQEETVVNSRTDVYTGVDGEQRTTDLRGGTVIIPGGTTVIDRNTPGVQIDRTRIVEYDLQGTEKLEELNTHYENPEMAQGETVVTSRTDVHIGVDGEQRTTDLKGRTVIIPGGTTRTTTTVIDRDSRNIDRTRIVEYDLQGTEKLEELNTYYETPEMAQGESVVTSIRRPDVDVGTDGEIRQKTTDRGVIIPGGTTRTTTTVIDRNTPGVQIDRTRIVEYDLKGTEKLEELNTYYETPDMAQGESVVTSIRRRDVDVGTDGEIQQRTTDIRDKGVIIGGTTRTTTTVIDRDSSNIDRTRIVEYDLQGTDKLEELNTRYETTDMAQDESVIITDDPNSHTSTRVITSHTDSPESSSEKRKHKHKKDVLSIETVKRGLIDAEIKGTEKLEELHAHYEHAGMMQPDKDSTDIHVDYHGPGRESRSVRGVVVPGHEQTTVETRHIVTTDDKYSDPDTLDALRVNYEGPGSPEMEENITFEQREVLIDSTGPEVDGSAPGVYIGSVDKHVEGRGSRVVYLETDTPNIALEKLRTTYEGPEYEMSEDFTDRVSRDSRHVITDRGSSDSQHVITDRVSRDSRHVVTDRGSSDSQHVVTDTEVTATRYTHLPTGGSKLDELDRSYEGREYTMGDDHIEYSTQQTRQGTHPSRTTRYERGDSPDGEHSRRYEGGLSPDRERQRVIISSSTPVAAVSGTEDVRTYYETTRTEGEDTRQEMLDEYDRIVRMGEEPGSSSSKLEGLRLQYRETPDEPETRTRVVTRTVRVEGDRPEGEVSGGYSVVSDVTSKLKADAKAEYQQYRIRRGSGSSFEDEFEQSGKIRYEDSEGGAVPFCPDGLTGPNPIDRDQTTEQKVETVYISKDGRIRSNESGSLVGLDVDPDRSLDEDVIVRGGDIDLGLPGDRSTTTTTTTTKVIRHTGPRGEPDMEQDSFNSSMRVNVDDSILVRREPRDTPNTDEKRNSSKYLEDEKVQAVLADYFTSPSKFDPAPRKEGFVRERRDEEGFPVVEQSRRLIKYEHSDSDHSEDAGMSNLKQELYRQIEAETPETSRTVVTRTTTTEEVIPPLQGHHEAHLETRQFDTMSTKSAPEPRMRDVEERSSYTTRSGAVDLESSSRKRDRSREKRKSGGLAYYVSIDEGYPKGPAIEIGAPPTDDLDRPALIRSSGQHDLARTDTRSEVSRHSTDTSSSNHMRDDITEGDHHGSRVVTERTVVRTITSSEPRVKEVTVDKNDNESVKVVKTETVEGPRGAYTMTVTQQATSPSQGFRVFRQDDSNA